MPTVRSASLAAALGVALACHRKAVVTTRNTDRPAVDSSAAIFADTTVGIVHYTQAREFDLRKLGHRDSLRAVLRKERALWRAQRPRAYRFLGRASCFCPGPQGWLLVEVSDSVLLRATNAKGKPVPLTDWSLFTIDKLFDNLELALQRDLLVAVAFDPRWHFPVYVSTSMRLPDTWSITEVRAFRAP